MDASVRLDAYKKNKAKGVAINGIPIELSELWYLQCGIFSPEDLNIIKRSPKERRNFVDMSCQLNKVYVSTLVAQ